MIISSRRSLLPRPREKMVSQTRTLIGIIVFTVSIWLLPVLLGHPITLDGSLFLMMVALTSVLALFRSRRLERLAVRRPNDSICTFARAFDYRKIDTRIIRAVHQELQHHFKGTIPNFPLRVSDRLEKDLDIDWEDIEDMAVVIAMRTRRSLDSYEANPFYGKLERVSDLVPFFAHQPMKT